MPDNDSFAATTYREILESIPEALIFADRDGIICVWNQGAEHLFGYPAVEAIGRSLDLIVPEALREAHWEGFHRAISQGATSHAGGSIITRSLHKSGQQLYVDMSFAVVRNQAGETIGSAAVARDATKRHLEEKNMRRRLAELEAKLPEQGRK